VAVGLVVRLARFAEFHDGTILRRLDAGKISAYIARRSNADSERRVNMIVIVRTSSHRAGTEPLS